MVSGRPIVARPERAAASSRTSPARGSGRAMGTVPRTIVTLVLSSRICLAVRLAMWAEVVS
jgi:hypothetical protein